MKKIVINDVEMTQTEYLYGVKKSTWSHLPYLDAIKVKIKRNTSVIKLINTKSIHDTTNEDRLRIKKCLDAISFNEKLLRE